MPRTNITIRREIPNRRGWARDKTCRLLAGWYQESYPMHDGAAVYVAEQTGRITGWSYCEWSGTEPQAVNLYVDVQV